MESFYGVDMGWVEGRRRRVAAIACLVLLAGAGVIYSNGAPPLGEWSISGGGEMPLFAIFVIPFALGVVTRSYAAMWLAPLLALLVGNGSIDSWDGAIILISLIFVMPVVAGITALGTFAGKRSDLKLWTFLTAVFTGVILLVSVVGLGSQALFGPVLSDAEQASLPTSSGDLPWGGPDGCGGPDHPTMLSLRHHLRENPRARVRFTFSSSDYERIRVVTVHRMAEEHLYDLENLGPMGSCKRRLADAIRAEM